MTIGVVLALLGASIAIITAAIGSAIGVMKIAAAANAVLTKEPRLFSRLLILILLPSSQTIYALTVAFMIFLNIGLIGDTGLLALSTNTGLAILMLCLPVAIIGAVTTITQGNTGVTAVNLFAKQNKTFGNCILIISASEVFALFGFLLSMLGVLFIDLTLVDPSSYVCGLCGYACECIVAAASAISPIFRTVIRV